jgi:SAM-dependent methyltransferase
MRRFWDARARENAFYFVDNSLPYFDPDADRFWHGGPAQLELMEQEVRARIEPDQDVIEIGCGPGRITRALSSRARTVRAFDVSEEMIAHARELNTDLANVEFVVGDGISLSPAEDRSADVVHSDLVFQHIPDPEITLGYVREMGRVLRPGGIAMFQFSNAPEIHRKPPVRKRIRPTLKALVRRGPGGQTHQAWLGSAIEIDVLRRVAEESGMELVTVAGEHQLLCRALLRKS